MRKSVLSFLVMLALALAAVPALAFAGEVSTQAEVYTVSFIGQDGNKLDGASVTVAPNGKVAATAGEAAAAAQIGYQPKDGKWYYNDSENAGAKAEFTFDSTEVKEDLSLYAEWEARTYTIKYNKGTANGTETEPATVYFKYGEGRVDISGAAVNDKGETKPATGEWTQATSITVAENPFTNLNNSNKNCRFDTWNTEANGSGTPEAPKAVLDGAAIAALQGDMTNNELTLTAQWVEIWTVTFDKAKHGDDVAAKIVDAKYEKDAQGVDQPVGQLVEDPGDLSANGYKFLGWYKVTDSSTNPVTLATEKWAFGTDKVTADTTLMAKWEDETFAITFTLDGTTISPQNVPVGTKASKPELDSAGKAIAKTGYSLYTGAAGSGDSGWYTDAACTKPYDFDTLVTGNVDLYAKWVANEYTINFDANGGSSSMSPVTGVKYDADQVLPANTLTGANGKEFLGWRVGDKDTGTFYADKATVKNLATGATGDTNVTLYAIWQDSFKIAFYADTTTPTETQPGDQAEYTQLVATNSTSAALDAYDDMKKVLKRDNYEFIGWNTVPQGEITTANPGTTYNDKATATFDPGIATGAVALKLYAQWKPNTYTFDFNANGGTVAENKTAPATQYMKYAEGQVNAAGEPVNEEGATKPSAGTWTQADKIVFPDAGTFERTGYTFGGWFTNKDYTQGVAKQASDFNTNTSVTENTTLYAKWNPVTYSVTFDVQGATDDKGTAITAPAKLENVVYGATSGITQIEIPALTGYTKNGYTLDGVWVNEATEKTYTPGEKLSNTEFAENTTLKVKWTPKQYKVTFKNIDGTVLDEQTIDYNTSPTFMKDLTAVVPSYTDTTGATTYEFKGWASAADSKTADVKAYTGTVTATTLASAITEIKVSDKDIEVFAWYDVQPAKYNATLKTNGLDQSKIAWPNDPAAAEYGKTFTKPASDPKADGYTFLGWYEAELDDSNNIVSVSDTAYDWSTVVTGDIALAAKWTTTDASKVITVPTAVDGLVYSGDYLVGVAEGANYTFGDDDDRYYDGKRVSEPSNSAVNAGDYTAVAVLDEGYIWSDGSARDQEIDYTIDQKPTSEPVVSQLTYNGNLQTAFKDIPEGIAYASGDNVIQKNVKADGDYITVFSVDSNYVIEGSTARALTVEWNIAPATVAVPKAVSGLKYTGKTLTGVKAGANYALKGNTGKAVKSYKATATLKDAVNYEWADGTTAAKSISWKIAKGANTISAKNASKTLKANKKTKKLAKKATITVKGTAKTAVKYAKSGKVGGNKITVAKNGKITVKKGLKKGTYNLKVKLTAAANANYVAAKAKTITVKIVVK